MRLIGEDSSRREGGSIKVRIVLSAEEVRRDVPSGDLEKVRKSELERLYNTIGCS